MSRLPVDKAADCACTLPAPDSGCRQVCVCPMASGCELPLTYIYDACYYNFLWVSAGQCSSVALRRLHCYRSSTYLLSRVTFCLCPICSTLIPCPWLLSTGTRRYWSSTSLYTAVPTNKQKVVEAVKIRHVVKQTGCSGLPELVKSSKDTLLAWQDLAQYYDGICLISTSLSFIC